MPNQFQPGWFAVTCEYDITYLLGSANHSCSGTCKADAVDGGGRPIRDPKTRKILGVHQTEHFKRSFCAYTRVCGSETARKKWKDTVIVPRIRARIQKEIAEQRYDNLVKRQDNEIGSASRPSKRDYHSYNGDKLKVGKVQVSSGDSQPAAWRGYQKLSIVNPG